MKRIEFRLSMPRRSSWNGKWSGEDKNYVIVKKISNEWAKEIGIEDNKKTSWYYRWDDGWTACITARVLKKGERVKGFDGFCGYDWMVDNILLYNSPYGKNKKMEEK